MNYQDYINLGFKRIELNDHVLLKQTGYGGFVLQKEINPHVLMSVSSEELNEPNLYVEMLEKEGDLHHIIPIPSDAVEALLTYIRGNNETTF
jgi:hypothetical protein